MTDALAFDAASIALIAAVFLLAGAVKGVVGLGLPTVSLGLLTAAFDLTTAMALLIAPSFATNLWQALAGGRLRALLRRLWPFLLAATLTVWVGGAALAAVDLALLSGLLGLLLAAYAGQGLAGFGLSIAPERQVWAGPAFGAVNGVLTGMTGSFVVPGVLYLQAIGLGRDALVQAMGILFTASTVALAVSLQGHGLMDARLGAASAAALLPALAGMAAGQALRRRLSEARFRRVFFLAVLALGLYIAAAAALALA